jgi:hypothetical protein
MKNFHSNFQSQRKIGKEMEINSSLTKGGGKEKKNTSLHFISPHFIFHQNRTVLEKRKKRGKEVEVVIMLRSLSSRVSLTGSDYKAWAADYFVHAAGFRMGISASIIQAEGVGLQSSVCMVGRQVQVAGFRLQTFDCRVQPADSRVRTWGLLQGAGSYLRSLPAGLGCRVQAVEFSLYNSG